MVCSAQPRHYFNKSHINITLAEKLRLKLQSLTNLLPTTSTHIIKASKIRQKYALQIVELETKTHNNIWICPLKSPLFPSRRRLSVNKIYTLLEYDCLKLPVTYIQQYRENIYARVLNYDYAKSETKELLIKLFAMCQSLHNVSLISLTPAGNNLFASWHKTSRCNVDFY